MKSRFDPNSLFTIAVRGANQIMPAILRIRDQNGAKGNNPSGPRESFQEQSYEQ